MQACRIIPSTSSTLSNAPEMTRPPIFIILATMVLASSCDKPRKLLNERAQIEAEIQRANEEMRALDAKFDALRKAPISYGMTLDHHLQEVARKNAKLEADLAYLSKKCAEGEAALNELRPRLDAYKAKYMH